MSTPPKKRAGRPALTIPRTVHGVRATQAGIEWLRNQAAANGHRSIGAWIDHQAQLVKK